MGDTSASNMQYVNMSGGSILLILRNAMYFVGSILFILSDTQYFRESLLLLLSNIQHFPGLGSAYTQHCALFPGDRYCLFYAIRSTFVGSILCILRNAQYFRRVDSVYT